MNFRFLTVLFVLFLSTMVLAQPNVSLNASPLETNVNLDGQFEITFDAECSDDNGLEFCFLDFGDFSSYEFVGDECSTGDTLCSETIEHTYEPDGTYTATLVAGNVNSDENEASVNLTLLPPLDYQINTEILANGEEDELEIELGETVTFDILCEELSHNDIDSCLVDFGDGGSHEFIGFECDEGETCELEYDYTYTELGEYSASLTQVSSTSNAYYLKFSLVTESVTINVVEPAPEEPEESTDIVLTLETQTIIMKSNDSEGVSLKVENTSNHQISMDLSAKGSSVYVDGEPSVTDLTLNGGERTTISLNVETTDAPLSTYNVEVKAEFDNTETTADLTVQVADEGTLLVNAVQGTDVCRTSNDSISVEVKNNSNKQKFVELSGLNEAFLPTFSEKEFWLDPNETRTIEMFVHTNSTTDLDDYTVTIRAETENEIVFENVSFEVVQCAGFGGENFKVTLDSSCTATGDNDELTLDFKVENLTDEEIELNVNTISDLITSVPLTITVPADEEEIFEIDVEIRTSDDKGKHDIDLYVWDSQDTITKTTCVNVGSFTDISFDLLENNLIIEQGKNEVYTLHFENTGNSNGNVKVTIDNDTDADTRLSSENTSSTSSKVKTYTVDDDDELDVFVSVSVPLDMDTGTYSIEVELTNTDIERTFLRFSVVEPGTLALEKIDITLLPITATLNQGEQGEFEFVLANFSTEDLFDAELSFEGLPQGVETTTRTVDLRGKRTVSLMQSFSVSEDAEPGLHTVKAKLSAGDKEVEKSFVLEIKEKAGFAPITGLFSVVGELGPALIIFLLAIILIALFLRGRGMDGPSYRAQREERNENKTESNYLEERLMEIKPETSDEQTE